jgi:hypothetical protein
MNPNKFMVCQYLIWFHEQVRAQAAHSMGKMPVQGAMLR